MALAGQPMQGHAYHSCKPLQLCPPFPLQLQRRHSHPPAVAAEPTVAHIHVAAPILHMYEYQNQIRFGYLPDRIRSLSDLTGSPDIRSDSTALEEPSAGGARIGAFGGDCYSSTLTAVWGRIF